MMPGRQRQQQVERGQKTTFCSALFGFKTIPMYLYSEASKILTLVILPQGVLLPDKSAYDLHMIFVFNLISLHLIISSR